MVIMRREIKIFVKKTKNILLVNDFFILLHPNYYPYVKKAKMFARTLSQIED